MGFQFPSRTDEAGTATTDGNSFRTAVQAQHSALFASFTKNVQDYASFDDFMGALEAQSWELLEVTYKQSYKNAMRARAARQTSKR